MAGRGLRAGRGESGSRHDLLSTAGGAKGGGAAAAGAGGVAALGAAGAQPFEEEEEEEEEGEEEEESEEAQVCWTAMFSFLPIILEVGAEFVGAALEAGICQYLAMLMVPVYQFLKSLVGIATAAPAPPAFAPPAPPPPPHSPTLVVKISTGMFGFAEHHPIIYLVIDFSM